MRGSEPAFRGSEVIIDQVRQMITHQTEMFNPAEPDRLIDSVPIPVDTYR